MQERLLLIPSGWLGGGVGWPWSVDRVPALGVSPSEGEDRGEEERAVSSRMGGQIQRDRAEPGPVE